MAARIVRGGGALLGISSGSLGSRPDPSRFERIGVGDRGATFMRQFWSAAMRPLIWGETSAGNPSESSPSTILAIL